MPPSFALVLWLILLLALLRFDPAKERETSPALWVPVIWIFIVATRLPSQWLGSGMGVFSPQAVQEGNVLDRSIYLLLILAAIIILISRSIEWKRICSANLALSAFLLFSLISILWSDFPYVSFKRWFRDLGAYLVAIVALTDPHGIDAVRTVLRRLCFLTIPFSILLNKYFPAMGKNYDIWTGQSFYIGATTSKNMLGVLCLISGLYFFWDILSRWGDRKDRRTRWIIGLNMFFFIMTLQLLIQVDSATSKVCLLLGCMVIAAAHSQMMKRRSSLLTVSIPVGICFYMFVEFGLGIDIIGFLSEAVGRSRNLTGRTDIWTAVLSTNTNPYVGTGYESFWLGSRLLWVWERAGQGSINEAHNGYLEVYLNLGLVGLFLLAGFLISCYRTICRRIKISANLGSLDLALWTVLRVIFKSCV